VIVKETLQAFYGADESPDSWLAAFQEHRKTIQLLTLAAHRRRPEQGVIVLRGTGSEGPFRLTGFQRRS
jgi:hypothetical protein